MREVSLPGRMSGSPDPTHREGEQGYLLVTAGVLILVIIALLSSYSFVLKRDANYKANYAAGQRFAETVAAAHFYAQQDVYDPSGSGSVNGNCGLLADMSIPDGSVIRPINNTSFTILICGLDEAPLNDTTPVPIKAASAYVQLQIRGPDDRSPSDTIAFLAGAASHGMQRVGIAGSATGTCDVSAEAAVLRWGPDPSACLTATHLATLGFTDVVDGDIIVPAWETALSQNDMSVIYRYRQPERPDMNAMSTDLTFDNAAIAGPIDCLDPAMHCLEGIDALLTRDVNAGAGTTTVGTGAAPGTFLSRQGSTAGMQGVVVNGAPVRIYDQTGTLTDVMTVDGTVDLTGTTTSVGGTMSATGVLATTSPNPVYTNLLGAKTADGEAVFDTTIDLVTIGATPGSAAIDKLNASVIGELNMTRAGGQLNTLRQIGNVGGTTSFRPYTGADPNAQLPVYAASITMNNSARITNTTNNLDWTVGAIDQRSTSPAQRLTMQDVQINQDCIGRGCPNSVNRDPTGGW